MNKCTTRITTLIILLILFSGGVQAGDPAADLNIRGTNFLAQGNIDKAFKIFNKAIAQYPNYSISYGNRGRIFEIKKEYKRAISDYDKVIELSPSIAKSYFNRGNVFRKNGMPDKAFLDYSAAIELDPNYAKALENRGILNWVNNKDRANACKDLAKACALNKCKVFRKLQCQ
jgi:tetratricopeptide (TPR) repeat protein